MARRCLLFLTAAGVSTYRWMAGRLAADGQFPADGDGLEHFAAYLRANSGGLFYLLADVGDEGFQLDELPFVSGRDRKALIERKLAQYFFGTPLTTFMSLGRTREGRRDERMLFAALTRPATFEPWLTALREAEAMVVGLFSMPIAVATAFTNSLARNEPILVATLSSAGLRQTFFQDGQLRFSRLTPSATGDPAEMIAACQAEAERTGQYLVSQRQIPRGTQLPVAVLAHPAQMPLFRERCRDSETVRFQFVDLAALAKTHKLATPIADSRCDALFLHEMAMRAPRHQFAPSAQRRFYRLWQTRTFLNGVAGVLLLAAMAVGAFYVSTIATATARNNDIRQQIEANRQRYDAVMHSLPKLPVGTDDLRQLVSRHDVLVARSQGPTPLLLHLSRALDAMPAIDLVSLHWQLSNRPDGTSASTALAPPSTANAVGGDANFAVLQVDGRLPLAMVNDHRAQLDTINAFAARLASDTIAVKVIVLPFETESGKSIKNAGESATTVEAPRFSLRLSENL